MAAPIRPVSLVAPGFYGLNTQDSPITLPKEFALRAENAVIDQYGRIAARKGWVTVNTTTGYNSTEPTLLHEVVKKAGTTEIVSIGNNRIYTGTTTLTEVYNGSATWTAQYWKAVNFNDNTYFFQRGHNPLIYDHVANTWGLVSAHPGYSGTVQLGNEVLGAYGRLWVADTTTDKTTIWWSDTLSGMKWSGGASGSISIEKVLTNGTDSIVALAGFNGFLVIFCKKTTIIYSGADGDPTSDLKLVEVIDGVGCIARDSVQDVGSDILFLSDTGVRSLGRLIQEKSAPLFDISRNVRDQLILDVLSNNDYDNIKSVFHEREGFYLLTLPTRGITYCFDLKQRLQDASCKTTQWMFAPKSLLSTRSRELYLGREGYIGRYAGNRDNGNSFRFLYYTSHLDAGDSSIIKILKKVNTLTVGGAGTNVFLKWTVDYGTDYRSALWTYPNVVRSEYNVSEYNIAEYNAGITINPVPKQFQGYGQTIGGAGRVFQLGIEADIGNDSFSVQQMDIFVKAGRTI
jgi:hypothetical protein